MIEMLKAQIDEAHTMGLRFGFKVGFWVGMASGAFLFLLVSMAVEVMF
jgi:hypothetical protein